MGIDLIDLIVRLLAGIMFFFFGVSSSPERPDVPPPPPAISVPQETIRSYTTISSVDVLVMESFPMQIQLQVTGEHPDGCELPVIVEQGRDGNTVTVDIYRELPGDVFCPMVLQPYADTIQLDGNFEPGDYVIKVNDFVVEITL